MSRNQYFPVAMSCCVALSLALAASAGACEPDPARPPIKVSVGTDGRPEVAPDGVSACVGETIRWIFKGSAAREFAVVFTSEEDSPFDWHRQTGATVTGTVRRDAVKDNRATEYKYSVEVDGKVLDPKIIIEP